MDVPDKCNGCSCTGQWKRGVCQYWHEFYSEPRRKARCNDKGPCCAAEQSVESDGEDAAETRIRKLAEGKRNLLGELYKWRIDAQTDEESAVLTGVIQMALKLIPDCMENKPLAATEAQVQGDEPKAERLSRELNQ